jgi:hypothetical protein
MPIKKDIKKFAEKSGKKPEVGASGTTNFQGTIDTEEYVADLKGAQLYTTIDKMRWSDASVQAALLMCELPIRSAEWDVAAASEDKQDVEIAEFVKENLFNGLVIPWEDTLRQILLMLPYGCMAFEVIYKVTEDGKIGWRKWAPRLPRTIEKWNINDIGELESITQRTYKGETFIEATIPIQKLMIFTYRREGDNYLGTSILRQAYKHWFFRDKYYKIDAVAQERVGIGIPVITLPDGYTDDDYTAAENMGKNLRGHEKAYVVIKDGWLVEMLDLKANTLKDPSTMLDHHTREILKSVLAQFIDLGSKSVGSYSLSADQSQIFLQALDSTAKQIEATINDEIKKLVDYNWTVEQYPKLTHADLGVKNVKELAEAVQTLAMAQFLTPDAPTEDYLRKTLKLPDKPEGEEMPSREEREQAEQEKFQQSLEQIQAKNQNAQEELNKGKKPEEKKIEKEVKKETKQKQSEGYFRELTKAEKRVKFDDIRIFMDEAEKVITNKMTNILNREKAGLLPKFEDAIRRNDYAELHQLRWQLKGVYTQMFQEEMKRMFEYGKLKSSYEVGKAAPVTTSEIMHRITERAVYLANRHEKQLMDKLKGLAAISMMDPEVTDEQAMQGIKDGFNDFAGKNITATASLITAEEINNGRKFTFEQYKDDLYGMQWSAILDGAVCNYCMSMDGKTIGMDDKAFSSYKPGEVHFGCRCIWVGIMKDEANLPPFTGVPDVLQPQTLMATWDFKDLDYPLPGSGGRKMPYGLGVYHEKGHNHDQKK